MLCAIGINLAGILGNGRADPKGLVGPGTWGEGLAPPQKMIFFSLEVACFDEQYLKCPCHLPAL